MFRFIDVPCTIWITSNYTRNVRNLYWYELSSKGKRSECFSFDCFSVSINSHNGESQMETCLLLLNDFTNLWNNTICYKLILSFFPFWQLAQMCYSWIDRCATMQRFSTGLLEGRVHAGAICVIAAHSCYFIWVSPSAISSMGLKYRRLILCRKLELLRNCGTLFQLKCF